MVSPFVGTEGDALVGIADEEELRRLKGSDIDSDGVVDWCDNCPLEANYNQRDSDNDGFGDACDPNAGRPNTAATPHLWTPCDTDNDCSEPQVFEGTGRCVPVRPQGFDEAGFVSQGPLTQFFTNPNNHRGRCVWPFSDRDSDGVVDYLDNCPKTSNPNQDDTDGDRIGDKCDRCDGVMPDNLVIPSVVKQTIPCGYSPGFTDATCQNLTNTNNAHCTLSGKSGPIGVCTQGKDSDKDGIGDACDACPDDKTEGVDPESAEDNCNLHSEMATGTFPYVPDACDPTPCAESQVAKIAYGVPEGIVDPQKGKAHTWTEVQFQPKLLSKNENLVGTQPYNYGNTVPNFTVGARFCRCNAAMTGATYLDCAQQCLADKAEFRYGQAGSMGSKWKLTNILRLNKSTYDPYSPPGGQLPPYPTVFEPNGEITGLRPKPAGAQDLGLPTPGLNGPYFFGWDIDLNAQPQDFPATILDEFKIPGVLWLHTRVVDGIGGITALPFRDKSNNYRIDSFGRPEWEPPEVPPEVEQKPCDYMCESKFCIQCMYLSKYARLWWNIDPADWKAQAYAGDRAVDLSSRIDSSFANIINSPDAKFMMGEEPSRFVRTGAPMMAMLGNGGTGVNATMTLSPDGKMQGFGRSIVIDDSFELGGTQGTATANVAGSANAGTQTATANRAAIRKKYGAVLSATEKAIFVIGGKEGKKWAKTLRRIDLVTGHVREVAYDGNVRPRKVLAATFRMQDRALYVVDEKRAWFGKFARILRIDLNDHRISVLGSWWKHPRSKDVYLSSGPDGTLVLSTSSRKLKYHAVFGLGVDDHGLYVKWDHIGYRPLAYEPQLN